MYTAQKNAHGNVIVCKGCDVRNSYKIIFTGSYNDCMAYKFGIDPSRIIFTSIPS